MNSLLDMFNYFCAQMMRNKVTADLSSNGSSSSFSSFSAVQAVSVEKSTKNVSVEKGMRFAPELDGLHCLETLIRS